MLDISDNEASSLDDWHKIKKETNQIRTLISSSKYASFLKRAFVRYARSLDGIDYESSFLKLWSLLEHLVVIKPNENFNEVIKRAMFLSKNENYDERMLEHLRLRRNASVHKGETDNDAEASIFQLKRYVEGLMRFHLVFGRRYATAEQIGSLLSKPRDVEVLEKRIAELKSELAFHKFALKFRGLKETKTKPEKTN